ncbi:MAG: NifB/NifX family molybdenum-iron cluster-binding protein [Bacteroidales bacterium]|nr:NifB/NifX family molybdenum-iron cluster-binding protein [Bacteroidales bacterium]
MKVAVPTAQGQVDSHFGHCAYFTIFEFDAENKIVSKSELPSPQGCGCKSGIAPILAEKGVSVMLAGNMGDGAVNVLANNNIKVIRGCSGSVDAVAESFIKGELVDNQIICKHECHH